MKKVAILGASGLVGSFLLEHLLNSEEIASVLSIGRKSLAKDHSKLSEHNGDLLNDRFWDFESKVDLVFVCIGTTKAKTPDEEKYKAIDYGIPLEVAKWAQKNGAQLISVVSSMGANAKSGNFYLRTKGEMEEALQAEAIKSHILRPSMILGPRNESRLGEKIGKIMMRLILPFLPKNYRPIEADSIAQAMLNLALEAPQSKVLLSAEIKGWAAN